MPPQHLTMLMEQRGKLETQPAGQVFHAQDFVETMFMLKKGYVKRYQITKENKRVIELIYGPGHIFPLSQLYRKIFTVEQNQEHLIYVYQTMTDVEIWRIADSEIESAIQGDWKLYVDLYYESGLRLRSNIDRLASNAIHDDYKKIAHQLVCLARDFGTEKTINGAVLTEIDVPLSATDIAEQLNISTGITEAVLDNLQSRNIITFVNNLITIPEMDILKDVYL